MARIADAAGGAGRGRARRRGLRVSSPATSRHGGPYADVRETSLARRARAARRGAAARRSRRARHRRRRAVPDDAVRRVDRRRHARVALSAGDDERSAALSSSSTAGILRAAGARAVVTSAGLVAAVRGAARGAVPTCRVVLSRDALDAPRSEPDSAPCARRHRVRAVHVRVDVGAQRRGAHARNLSANIDAFNGPAGVAASPDGSSASAGCR